MRSAIAACSMLAELSGLEEDKTSEQSKLEQQKLKPALKQLGKNYQVQFKLAKQRYEQIDVAELPLAFLHQDGTWRILARLNDEQALIQDPLSENPVVVSRSELKTNWKGPVIHLGGPTLRFDISWFIPEFTRHRHLLGEILLFSLLLQILALATPLFFQVVMDKVLVHNALTTLDVLVVVLVLVGLFDVVLKGLREYLFAHTSNRIDIRLGAKLFKHLLGLPLLYFKTRQVGTIVTRVRELDSIREFLTGSALTLSVDVVFTFVFLGVMAWLSLPLTLIVLASLPLYVLLTWSTSQRLHQRVEHQFQCSAKNTSFLTESVAGAETVKSLAVEPRMQRRWESQTQELVTANFRTQTLNLLASQGVQLLQKVTSVLVIWYGAHQVMQLEMSIGQLIAFNMMVSHVSQPIAKLVDLWQQFVQTRVAVDALGDILNLPVEQELGDIQPDCRIRGDIWVSDLSFSYQPDLPPVLKDVDLRIRAGEMIGIVGPSGSGKSTLTKLLQKLYLPTYGQIQVDGHPLISLSPNYLRSQIGVVLQENYLFNRSVRDNIALKVPTAGLDDVVLVARLAGAHDFILQLPMGYDTVLAEGGGSLSGGQRQRVAIARALMGDPGILILDEATSALDDESQALIQRNMAAIAQDRTVIIIAHRLSTVRECDRIITLEDGCITQQGTHQQLIAQTGGCYARLWQLQSELKQEQVA